MEERDRSRSPSHRTSRVEQVVGRWLRRSRDSSSRERILVDGRAGESGASDQRNYPVRLTVQILKDPLLNSHGLSLSPQIPILVQDVHPGGPADGRLIPGDQVIKINNVAIDDLTPEQAADIIRECQDSVTMTVLRTTVGPKSSFITPEKRAKLKSNPVKVRFAEEVAVNGHSQGNSLLFLPNVLKVYLENGQTKAFKFEPNTTVKDIVMTLKEKLSLSRIEHFSLVLEQQYSITKLLLLHDEERIQQVVQKRESHDFRCLFRVCFMPRDPQDMLQDDPTAFEYLYLQGVNDVLQERFAVEMRCNTALRLAALHIQERLASCGQSPKTNLKIITKTWGIENFVSSTLLRNMREKDLRKAIGYHMKKSQAQIEPKQKVLTANQARTNYLEELSDLKSFGGKSFSATMMLQDRESMVTLLVGARYGVSQVVNHKLSIMTTLTEFSSITRIELLPESERVSLVKIYLQEIKPITLLLESVAAKDLSCLVAGYCRLLVDPNINIFPWTDPTRKHRVSAEEGYVSRCGSDTDDSSDLDMDTLVTLVSYNKQPRPRSTSDPEQAREQLKKKRKEREEKRRVQRREKSCQESHKKEEGEKDEETRAEHAERVSSENRENEKPVEGGGETEGTEEEKMQGAGEGGNEKIEEQTWDGVGNEEAGGGAEMGIKRVVGERGGGGEILAVEDHPSVSEASESCRTDSRFITSISSDSLDALEEDDLISCSSSAHHHIHPHTYPPPHPHLLSPPAPHAHPLFRLTVDPPHSRWEPSAPHQVREGGHRTTNDEDDPHLSPADMTFDPVSDNFLCFAELSRMVDYLPSPPEASEDEDEDEGERERRETDDTSETGGEERDKGEEGCLERLPTSPSPPSHLDCVFNFEQSDARCYYNICSNVTPDSAHSLSRLHSDRSPAAVEAEEEEEEQEEEEQEEEESQPPALELESVPILQPPPGFGDSSSEEEFFDASDRFASPEDTTSGAVPRDFAAEMREDSRSVSPSDIGISIPVQRRDGKEDEGGSEEEGGGSEEVGGGSEEEGRGREARARLRRRSRKRRSFMETNFTSRVSFPETDPDNSQDQDQHPYQNSGQKNHIAQADDSQMLSADPEPSEQTQNPSPTVSCLKHTEGEPAQLESKPILTMPSRHRDPDEDRKDLLRSSRSRQQEMEMEPDSMEFKSVTALVTAACPSISAVRSRVEPDGKESADRRGDGEEEEKEGQKQVGMSEEEGDERGGSLKGACAGHMFLAEILEEEEKEEETGEEKGSREKAGEEEDRGEETGGEDKRGMETGEEETGEKAGEEKGRGEETGEEVDRVPSPSTEEPTVFAEEGLQTNNPPHCFNKEEKGEDVPVRPLPRPSSPSSHNKAFGAGRVVRRNFIPPSHPPPPPPTPSLPPLHDLSTPHLTHPERGQGGNRGMEEHMPTNPPNPYLEPVYDGLLTKIHGEELPNGKQTESGRASVEISYVPTIAVHTATENIVGSITSILGDGYNSSLSSSNAIDEANVHSVNLVTASDDEGNANICDLSLDRATTANVESPAHVHLLTAHIQSLTSNTDFAATINSITAKLDATAGIKPTPVSTASTVANVKASILLDSLADTKKAVCKTASLEANASTANDNVDTAKPKVTTFHKLPNEPPSLSGFLLQPCSPGIIGGRLSASTLRGKIQSLPLYLSRSQETLSQTGLGSTVKGPSREVITKVTAENKVGVVKDTSQVESAESDDSEVTLTGSDVEGEVVIETTGAEITRSTVSEVKELMEKVVKVYESPPLPIRNELKPLNQDSEIYISEPKIDTYRNKTDIYRPQMNNPVHPVPAAIVVTTQSLNGPGLSFPSMAEPVGGSSVTSKDLCKPAGGDSGQVKLLSTSCGVFTVCEAQPKTQSQAHPESSPPIKPDFGCSSILASGCESVLEGVQTPLDACGCPMVYTNCFSGGDSFDDELTVYEFSCRTQSDVTHASGVLPLMTSLPSSSFLSSSPSASLSPSFPRLVIPPSSSTEVSPLLSPLESSNCFLSEAHKETISRLRQRHYPAPPAGFQTLRGDVDQLLSILEGGARGGRGGRHPRDSCPAHFSENKRTLHGEARRLMAGCQKVVRVGQSPEEMLLSLADSFQTLVELTGVCLWFSGCDRCDRRNSEAVAGLADVARAFREFALAAERASGRRTCHDLSTKLLAKQCTALTASVFCLTQLFRTLTAL
ncbi:FERM and PDZ domain-containing protein 1 [Osmerus eperlanus]|uniref:FERM and PDZ domain-containing protein 1 n=1 Tax=Osmerus eperlanus TaxID=29151 RepID=UPI002E142E0D